MEPDAEPSPGEVACGNVRRIEMVGSASLRTGNSWRIMRASHDACRMAQRGGGRGEFCRLFLWRTCRTVSVLCRSSAAKDAAIMKMTAGKLLSRQADGPLTRELVLEPGRFGLGKVPLRLAPDDVASMVCGFCSTGCALNVHLRKGAAINITPTTDYPVNLGMACPKGWEALTPLAAADRATTPLLRDAAGATRAVDWDTAMQVFTLRLKAIQDRHGPESIAWLGSGQITTDELAFFGGFGKFA